MSKIKHHAKKVRAHAKKHFPTVKKHVKRVWAVWQLVVLVLLSAALIPIFLHQGTEHSFFAWIVPMSVAIYLIVTVIHLRLKSGFIKSYLEKTATRLLLGVTALCAAFLTLTFGISIWGHVLLVAAAVLYASFLQQISFFRVIGL